MESGAGSAERSIRMDERDVFISRIRKEMEDKENENKELQVKLELLRRDNDRAIEEVRKARKDLDELREHYEEIRDKYTQMIGSIMDLIDKLKR